MLNHVTIQGRLTRDMEKKTTQGGIDSVQFTVAWSEKFKKADGSEGETKCFLPCKAWRGTATLLDRFFHNKGTEVLLEGRLETEEWETQQGERRSRIVLNVDKWHFCGKKDSGQPGQAPASGAAPATAPAGNFTPVNDELPF